MAQFRSDQRKIDSEILASRYEVQMLSDQITPSGTAVDAFGRIRTSQPVTLFDSNFRFSDDTLNWSILISGTASTQHNTTKSSISMNVGTVLGDKNVRQSKRYLHYQPGKSLLVLNSFTMQPKINVRQRVGYFDANNGIFLEHDGTTAYIVKRSNKSGSVVETKIPQSDWSEDQFDGTGYSGIALDFTKSQIQWMDIEWLGVGSVRVGFVVNGVMYIAHKFHHANIEVSTYMTTASLPVRYEIENTSSTSGATTLEHICNTVISEGGYKPTPLTKSISTPLAGTNISSVSPTPVIAIRLKSNRIGGIVTPHKLVLYGEQSVAYQYNVIQSPTITGGTWTSAGADSHVEYNITPTSFSGGETLLQGMFAGGSGASVTDIDLTEFGYSQSLRTTLDGTMEVFLIALTATTTNDQAVTNLTWEQYN